MSEGPRFRLDGQAIPFAPGQTVMEAALAAGVYVPHLCFHPDFEPHGSCKVCTCEADGRLVTGCTHPAAEGMEVASETEEIRALRQDLVQFLFTEGNHFCPSCPQSGDCRLQDVGYDLGVTTGHYHPRFPVRPIDTSHPDAILDHDRCILCELCVRASAEIDGKHVFALSGRGIDKHVVVSAESGRLADTPLAATDAALAVCPVGALVPKRGAFSVPIGARASDVATPRQRAVRRVRGPTEPGP